jgi:hypothetical protein
MPHEEHPTREEVYALDAIRSQARRAGTVTHDPRAAGRAGEWAAWVEDAIGELMEFRALSRESAYVDLVRDLENGAFLHGLTPEENAAALGCARAALRKVREVAR